MSKQRGAIKKQDAKLSPNPLMPTYSFEGVALILQMDYVTLHRRIRDKKIKVPGWDGRSRKLTPDQAWSIITQERSLPEEVHKPGRKAKSSK